MTFYQILATRIDWLGFVLIGLLLGELVRALIRLFKHEPPPEVVPFHRPSRPAQPDPAATLPIQAIRLDDTPIEPVEPDPWEQQQGRFW